MSEDWRDKVRDMEPKDNVTLQPKRWIASIKPLPPSRWQRFLIWLRILPKDEMTITMPYSTKWYAWFLGKGRMKKVKKSADKWWTN